MDDRFNSISVISGRWAADYEKLRAMESCLRLTRVRKCNQTKIHVDTGITLAQNFRATSRLRPGDLERCFNKQGDTRLHVAAVLNR